MKNKKHYEKPSMKVYLLQSQPALLQASQTDGPFQWGYPGDDR